MKISEDERLAVRNVIVFGHAYGFGNLITHLRTAWARALVSQDGFTERDARRAAGGDGMPFKMQDDIVERGEWDETGERYK